MARRGLTKIWRYVVPLIGIGAIVAAVLLTKQWDAAAVRKKAADLQARMDALPTASDPFFQGTVTAAQTDRLTLSLDCDTGFVTVSDKQTGRVYSSNPPDWETDTRVESKNRSQLASQLEITFYDKLSMKSTYNTHDHALALGQILYQRADNGFRAIYILGKTDARKILPAIIRESSMNKLLEKMDDDTRADFLFYYKLLDKETLGQEAAEVIRQYPLLERERLYELRSSAQERIQKVLEKSCTQAGYTMEDLEKEYAAIGYEAAELDNYFAVIPVLYTLEDDAFCVRIRTEEIIESTATRLNVIRLLPYFGYADGEEQGYFLVPDGSGALIRLNRSSTAGYSQTLYGEDPAVDSPAKTTYSQTAVMPVFGCQYREGAVFAVIEEGAANASLTALPAGVDSSYNHIYPTFSYRTADSLSLSASLYNETTMSVVAEGTAKTDFAVRYFFPADPQAGYAGMAALYRGYLQDTGALSRDTNGDTSLPFLLSVYGSVDRRDAVLGIPVVKETALTTFDQAAELLTRLTDDGVRGLRLQYHGWTNGGVRNGPLDTLRLQRNLGGKKGFSRLAAAAEERGVGLFPVLDFGTVYRDGWFDGYAVKQDTARFINKKLVTASRYSPATGLRAQDAWTGYVVSPGAQTRLAERLLESGTLPATGVSLGGYGLVAGGSYDADRFYDRSDAIAAQQQVVGLFAEKHALMLSGGIASLLTPEVELIDRLPLSSSGFLSEDTSVPFYQMVLHGYVAYTGEPLNLAQDYRENLLRTIESGAGLAVDWMAAENQTVFDTVLQDKYAMNSGVWYEQAVSLYRDLNEALGETAGLRMTGHAVLREGLTMTAYEDGRRVYVNYTDAELTADGVAVPPQWFAVKGVGQ